MKTQCTNKQLSEMIKSDAQADELKQQIIRDTEKSMFKYNVSALLLLIDFVFILYLMITTAPLHDRLIAGVSAETLIWISMIALMPLCIITIKREKILNYLKQIENTFTPIKESNRCTEVKDMITEHVEALAIQKHAIQNNRQLYNFDADLMDEIITAKMEELVIQNEKTACKQVHGLLVTE